MSSTVSLLVSVITAESSSVTQDDTVKHEAHTIKNNRINLKFTIKALSKEENGKLVPVLPIHCSPDGLTFELVLINAQTCEEIPEHGMQNFEFIDSLHQQTLTDSSHLSFTFKIMALNTLVRPYNAPFRLCVRCITKDYEFLQWKSMPFKYIK